MQNSRHSVVPTALFAGLTGISAIAAGWFGLETWLLATKRQPITWYTRNQVSNHIARTSLVIALAAFALGAAVTHFVADEHDNP